AIRAAVRPYSAGRAVFGDRNAGAESGDQVAADARRSDGSAAEAEGAVSERTGVAGVRGGAGVFDLFAGARRERAGVFAGCIAAASRAGRRGRILRCRDKILEARK